MGKDTTVAIVGDGNAAHVLIPFLGGTHHTVNLLSLNPHKWDRTVRCEVQNMKHEVLKVRKMTDFVEFDMYVEFASKLHVSNRCRAFSFRIYLCCTVV